jgi:hypothetical protein
LESDGRIVGFLGLIYSARMIRGESRRFCNLTHWAVNEEHRNHSLALVMDAMRQRGYTMTSLSPTPPVAPIYAGLKWKDLHNRTLIAPWLPWPGGGGARLHFNPAQLATRLSEPEQQILRDHKSFACRHLLIEDPAGVCYVVYTRVQRKRLPFVMLHYIGDTAIFLRHAARLRWRLCFRERAVALLIEDRLLRGGSLPACYVHSGDERFYYPAGDLEPHEIDSLYSEYIVLNL